VTSRIGCPIKANEQIGFKAEVSLDEGLEHLIEWRANHKAEVAARREAMRIPTDT